jgi:radical SAM protein with 4Fe4S-binding SPASM domain
MNNFRKLENKKVLNEIPPKEIDYKKRYYALIREMQKLPNQMCDDCPIVRSCCGGCDLLRRKLNRIKKDPNWGLENRD